MACPSRIWVCLSTSALAAIACSGKNSIASDTGGAAQVGGATSNIGGGGGSGGNIGSTGGVAGTSGGGAIGTGLLTDAGSTGGTTEGDGSTGTGGSTRTGGSAGTGPSTQTGGSSGSGAAGAGGAGTSSSGTGGGTAAVDIGPWASCPPTDPASMVALPDGYSIGRTEVTIAQYQAWLRTSPAPNLQIPDCSWNTSFVPHPTLYSGDDCNYQSDCCNYPVVHVDWCDAYAYCQGIGKRLCGKIGGGPNGWNDYANENSSQWYNACSSHGVNTYVYGNIYNPNTCNTEATDGGQTKVAAHLQCQSSVTGYQGVYDITGNVREWEDSCDEATHYCRLRAGSSYGTASTGSAMTCAFDSSVHRSFTLSDIGFRCCSSP